MPLEYMFARKNSPLCRNSGLLSIEGRFFIMGKNFSDFRAGFQGLDFELLHLLSDIIKGPTTGETFE
ncbi:hypothetical protein D3C76_416510 [compost metagenome]